MKTTNILFLRFWALGIWELFSWVVVAHGLGKLLASFQLGQQSKGSGGAEKSMSRSCMWPVAGLCSSLVIGKKVWIFLIWVSSLSSSLYNSLFHPQGERRKKERERASSVEATLSYNLISEVIVYHFCLMILGKQVKLGTMWGDALGCEWTPGTRRQALRGTILWAGLHGLCLFGFRYCYLWSLGEKNMNVWVQFIIFS